MSLVLLSPGKTLTDPLVLLTGLAMIFLLLAWRRARNDRPLQRLLAGAMLTLLLLAFLSTSLAERFVEWTLSPNLVASRAKPDVIVVASGGSLPGPTREFDLLAESSASRIIDGARWWREHPDARMILTGADMSATGPSIRTLELMRDVAIRHGVRPDAITIEGHSFNTREHAVQIAKLPGIERSMQIGLVTSPWHMRRARAEFERYFPHVIPHAAGSERQGFIVNDFIPSSVSLRSTTRLLHEWLGIAWYALRR